MDECNFKRKGMCRLTNYGQVSGPYPDTCSGEDNCILFQMYKMLKEK